MAAQATALPDFPPTVRRIPVDGHVHFHHRELVAVTLDAALANFRALGAAGITRDCGVLLLAQAARESVFEWLRARPVVGAWSVTSVPGESQSLWLRREQGTLLVVCGRQVIAEPGLEVIALGTDQRIEDGLGLEPTLALARSAAALAVLPWGFGKWTGRRKLRIRKQLAVADVSSLWVGDNGGRLRNLGRPRLLDEAEARGIGVLPGTDPFPFGRDYRRVGSFGFLLDLPLVASRPWQSVRAALVGLKRSPEAYGRSSGSLGFGFRQAWMQVHKRLHGRPD